MKADVVIINYRTHRETSEAVKSVMKYCDFGQIVVVDNSDNWDHWRRLVVELLPGVGKVIDCYYSSDDVNLQIIRAERNLGFGGGCNYAIRKGELKSDLIWFLNSDCVLTEDALSPLVNRMKNGKYSALSSFTYKHGSHRLNKFGVLQVWNIKCFLGWFRNISTGFNPIYVNDLGIIDSFSCYGASFVVTREQFDFIGGFDENYFMYLEETDLVYRLKKHFGTKSGFVESSKVVHKEGGSFNDSYDKNRKILRNYLYFVRKNYSGIQQVCGLLFYVCKLILTQLRKVKSS
jgi:GT2 family glycosyltransferase